MDAYGSTVRLSSYYTLHSIWRQPCVCVCVCVTELVSGWVYIPYERERERERVCIRVCVCDWVSEWGLMFYVVNLFLTFVLCMYSYVVSCVIHEMCMLPSHYCSPAQEAQRVFPAGFIDKDGQTWDSFFAIQRNHVNVSRYCPQTPADQLKLHCWRGVDPVVPTICVSWHYHHS